MSLETDQPTAPVCYIPAFKVACAADDPWGCTMLAYEIFEGTHIEQDYERALDVMSKSCKFGEDDPACSHAIALKAEINRLQSEQEQDE